MDVTKLTDKLAPFTLAGVAGRGGFFIRRQYTI